MPPSPWTPVLLSLPPPPLVTTGSGPAPTGGAALVYCDPTRSCGGVTGGWSRVAELDMTNSSQQCPSPLRQRDRFTKRSCGTSTNSCSSLTFPSNSLSYSKVCGKIIAYQFGSPDSYGVSGANNRLRSNDINTNYVDGVSLTHGPPRQHIWTFSAAADELNHVACPCINRNEASTALQPPAFVGNDYFCDTGASSRHREIFYAEDPLWDGAGCGPLNDCCSFNKPSMVLQAAATTHH